MGNRYQRLTANIPWKSFGRKTIATQVKRSLLPVGILPFKPEPLAAGSTHFPVIEVNGANFEEVFEKYFMNIVGSAIQAGDGKLVTCAHVAEPLMGQESKGYVLSCIHRDGTSIYIPYRIQEALRFVDPRTNQVNKKVDLAVLLCAAKSTRELPYEALTAHWGDSTRLGIGDRILIGGYPHGRDMFRFMDSNQGIIQPTFYGGVISAILPATEAGETRVLQISIPVAGGMSGGAVFDPRNGKILGMVFAGVDINIPTINHTSIRIPQPMTYALPSEIIAPFVKVISFKRKS